MSTEEEIDLRKKEKKIDRSHWMCKLQAFTFGIDAPTYYMGYCPFFWMTWVSLIALPFVLLFKLVTGPTVWLWDKFSTPYSEYKLAATLKLENTPVKPSYNAMLDIAEEFKKDKDIRFDYSLWIHARVINYKQVYLWLQENPNWRKIELPKAKEWLKVELERLQKEKERNLAKAKKLRKVNFFVASCGSLIFKIVIPICIAVVAAGVTWLLYQAAIVPSLCDYITVVGIASVLGFSYVLAKIVMDAFKIYFTYLDNNDKSFWLTSLLRWIIGGFVTVYEFISETVSMTYKQECPLIIWGEETGPIQKRTK